MDANLQSFIRMLLAAAGAFFIGNVIAGTEITNAVLDTGIGVVVELFSLVWGIKTKTNSLEAWQSVIRNVFSFVGGFFVSKGIITADKLILIIGAGTALAAYLYSVTSKAKTIQLQQGKLTVSQLVQPGKKAA